MHNISLRLGRKAPKTFYLPACWAELKADQWQQVGRIVDDSQPRHLFALLGLWSGLTLAHLEALNEEMRLRLLDLLTWLDTPPSRWMEPTLKLKGDTLRGPGDDLVSLPFGGFLFAEAALKRLGEPGELIGGRADLLAALYRPLDAQRRLAPFSVETMHELGELLLATRHQGLLKRTHYNYLGARQALITQFPGIFKPSTGDTGGSSTTWLDVGLSLARQTNALGTYAQLEQTNVYLVLTTLQALIDENEKAKAQAQK